MPLLTCKQGTNADLFPDIAALYIPEGSKVLDATWGRGIFWKKMDQGLYDLVKNDIDPERGDVHHDFTKRMPFEDNSFDVVVIDPPYLYTGGFKTLKDSIDRGYNNKARAIEQGISGVDRVNKMYYTGMQEAYRLLRHKGYLITKSMDQVMSGKQEWLHMVIHQYAEEIGYRAQDLFILMQNGQPTMRHKRQLHARRNHSYFQVFKAWKK